LFGRSWTHGDLVRLRESYGWLCGERRTLHRHRNPRLHSRSSTTATVGNTDCAVLRQGKADLGMAARWGGGGESALRMECEAPVSIRVGDDIRPSLGATGDD